MLRQEANWLRPGRLRPVLLPVSVCRQSPDILEVVRLLVSPWAGSLFSGIHTKEG